MLLGLISAAMIIGVGFFSLPSDVANGPKQQLQSPQLLGKKTVAAGSGNCVVQAAIKLPRFFNEPYSGPAGFGHALEFVSQRM